MQHPDYGGRRALMRGPRGLVRPPPGPSTPRPEPVPLRPSTPRPEPVPFRPSTAFYLNPAATGPDHHQQSAVFYQDPASMERQHIVSCPPRTSIVAVDKDFESETSPASQAAAIAASLAGQTTAPKAAEVGFPPLAKKGLSPHPALPDAGLIGNKVLGAPNLLLAHVADNRPPNPACPGVGVIGNKVMGAANLLLADVADSKNGLPHPASPGTEVVGNKVLSADIDLFQYNVKSLIEDAKGGGALNVTGSSASTNASSSSSLPSIFPAGSASPLSPRSTAGSARVMRRGSGAGPSTLGSPLKLVSEPVREAIQFYLKNGRAPPKDLREQCLSRLDHLFFASEGHQIQEFRSVIKDVCKLPPFLSGVLFKKIDAACSGTVTRDAFIEYWINDNKITMDTPNQIFEILRKPGYSYLTQEDFKPVLKELLATHPGLEFLQGTPEFQERYAESVIYRIFYSINRCGNGHLTLRELKRGNLVAAMQQLDEEDDINKVLRYFSYEHFYVIYCKFWELDTDHDFLIDKENLIRYGNHSLTYRIVDRDFSQMVLNNTEDRFAQEFGIKVLLACVLPPHMLSYHNSGREKRCAPSSGQWNMMISEACVSLVESLYHKNLPPDTFVAVQKRHHTRLFPEIHGKRDMADKSASIRPETVVVSTSVSSGQPVGQYITNPLSSSSDIGKNDIQIFIKLLDFPSFPMCFDLNCEIKTVVTSAQHKVGVYLTDPKIEYSSRNAYFEDTLSSLRAVNNTTLIISQRLRGGIDTIALLQYAVSLGDALFDTVTLPPELHYPNMDRFYISLASDGMNLYDMMFALLDSYHLQHLCLGPFGPEDILYDRTDRILIFTDNVEIALYTLEGYWNNLGSTGNVFAAIFKYDERKVRSAIPGIHTTGLHGRLPHLVELLVEDLTVVVRTSQDDESDVKSRKYFRRHVVQMPLADQLAFYLTFDLHIDYLGGSSSIQTYIGSFELEESWITPELRSSAIATMTTLGNYNGLLVGSQWSCSRNVLSHAKDNLLHKFSEKQAVAFINLVFRRLFRNVLLKATFKIIQVDWDQPQVAKRTIVYAPKISNQLGGQLLVSNNFTFGELLSSRRKTIQIR